MPAPMLQPPCAILEAEHRDLSGVRHKTHQAAASTAVEHDEPPEKNPMGQSGIHTVCDDIIDIVLEADGERDAYRALITYFMAEEEK